MYLHQGEYLKGHMAWDVDTSQWRFPQCRKNGVEIFGISLPNFHTDFQCFIDDGTLVPGWHSSISFICSGNTRHVLVSTLACLVPPGSTTKALHPLNPDKDTWYQSYKEEYDGLMLNDTFHIISEEEYNHLRHHSGVHAIPSTCIFTVKHTDSVPTRAQSRIVVLGNLDRHDWGKLDCFAPVVSIPMIRFLTALAVQHGRTLKQGD
jgi:hypothetical protein